MPRVPSFESRLEGGKGEDEDKDNDRDDGHLRRATVISLEPLHVWHEADMEAPPRDLEALQVGIMDTTGKGGSSGKPAKRSAATQGFFRWRTEGSAVVLEK